MSLLKLMVSVTRSATRALHIQALVLLTLTLTVPGVVGAGEYLRIKALVIVYTDTFAGTTTYDELENVRREVDEAVEFIWRSSRMRLHLAVDDLTIYGFVPEAHFRGDKRNRYALRLGPVTTDLEDLGYQDGSYDIVMVFYAFDHTPEHRVPYGAASWGMNILLDKAGYLLFPMAWRPHTFNKYVEHEFLHVLSDIIEQNGYTDYPVLHNRELFQWINGEDASYNKWILGSFSDAEYLGATGRWGSVETFKDRDDDGVPDYSLYGEELSITEETLGSSTSHADTDGDGLSDLEEVTAGVRSGTDPNHPDTDGDGLIDGSDPDPLDASEAEAR